MEKRQIITKTITFLILLALLGPILGFEISEASQGYVDIYPTLSQSEKEEISTAMFWLHDVGEFHYKDKYREDSIVFRAMEQSHANLYNKNFKHYWDYGFSDDPLGIFGSQAYDKGESSGIDWYLKNFWNINPTYTLNTKENIESYYHQGYYYKFYHNFPIMSEPTVGKLYDLGKNYYCAEYKISYDYDWDEYHGPYYAIFKKKNIEGHTIWSAIYAQDREQSLTLDKVVEKVFYQENIAKPTRSKVLVNGKDVKFEAYNIKGNNYFKLRDLALILNGTASSFEVGWDGNKNAINLVLGKDYTPTGGELEIPENLKSKEATLSSSKVFLNGKEVNFTSYTIAGNNYFKLRDLGDILGFIVDWDQKESTVIINTNKNKN